MSRVETREVKRDEAGMRLDRWFRAHYPALTHGRLQKLLRTGQVRVDGGRARANARLAAGQTVRVPPLGLDTPPPEERPGLSKAESRYVRDLVIHTDDDVIALNKPAGLAVQGGTRTARHLDGLLDALVSGEEERPRLVHRLDKDTSGVLLLARSRAAATALGKALKDRSARKLYWALVTGVPRPAEGEIRLPLAKTGGAGEERVKPAEADRGDARTAVTRYAVIEPAGKTLAWVALWPVTGRTHQLRVHMAAIGHPIAGDGKYGGKAAHPGGEIPGKLHLHARSLTLPHPRKGTLRVTAPLPEHMARSWKLLGLDPELDTDPFGEAV